MSNLSEGGHGPRDIRPALMEGGGHKCVKDDFYTDDENEWEAHCSAIDPETNQTHVTESGAAPCIICGIEVEYENLPFPRFKEGRKIIQVTCEDCSTKIGTGRAVNKK